MRMALVKLALVTGAGLVALAACGSANDGYDPTVPTNMTLQSGAGQEAEAGTALPELLTVITTNLVGDPVAGVTVEWSVVSGGGRLSSATTDSDADGISSVTFTLGPSVGAQAVRAVASVSLIGSPVTFGATATPPPPADGGGGGAP